MIEGVIGTNIDDPIRERRARGYGLVLVVTMNVIGSDTADQVAALMGLEEGDESDELDFASLIYGGDVNLAPVRAQALIGSLRVSTRPAVVVGQAAARMLNLPSCPQLPLIIQRVGRSPVRWMPAPIISRWWDDRNNWTVARSMLTSTLEKERARWARC